MNKWFSWTLILWLGLTFSAFGTTPSRPKIRYSVENQTNQSVSTILQLESADSSFSKADTTEVKDNLAGDFVGYAHDRYQFGRYIKLLIQTNERQYVTPVFLYEGRCAAYTIELTERGVTVSASSFYAIRRQIIAWYIVFMVTFSIRGGALLLIASPHVKNLLLPFVGLNTALVVLFELASSRSTAVLEWNFLYSTALVLSLVEGVTYYALSREGRRSSRLLFGIVLGSLLWVFPGYLLILFGRFIFAGC